MKITPYQRQRAHEMLDAVIDCKKWDTIKTRDNNFPGVFLNQWEYPEADKSGDASLMIKIQFIEFDQREQGKERRKG